MNQTKYAHWKSNTVTLTVSANGARDGISGKFEQSDVQSPRQYIDEWTIRVAITPGQTLSEVGVPNPEADGANFCGWKYLGDNGFTSIDANAVITESILKEMENTGSYTVWADWDRYYTITYDANGGTGAPSKQVKFPG